MRIRSLLISILLGATAWAQVVEQPRLYVISLPAGDVPGWSIDFPNWSGHAPERKYSSSAWLRDQDGDGVLDYDGVLFVGAGKGVTHVRPAALSEATVLVARHNGVVRIEGATIHCGRSQGVFFGLETPGVPIAPNFRLELQGCEVVSDPPAVAPATASLVSGKAPRGPPDGDGRSRRLWRAAEEERFPPGLRGEEIGVYNAYRSWLASPSPSDEPGEYPVAALQAASPTTTKWGIFAYQADVVLRDCAINIPHSAEHGQYSHGFARDGVLWERVHVRATGAEQLKLTARPWECAWVPTARAIVRDSIFQRWYQPWSWRGGAGIVDQAAGIPLTVTRCLFKNPGANGSIPASQRTRCIMIDDGGDNDGDGVRDFYGAGTGVPGQGFANGRIRIIECAFYAGPGIDSLSTMIRVGKNAAGPWLAAESFVLKGCALYGEKLQLQLRDVASGMLRVSECNTPALAAAVRPLGVVTTYEALIPLADRAIPASQGLVR